MFTKYRLIFIAACQMYVVTAMAAATCEIYIRQQENFYKIPTHLLKAVSLIESGRTIQQGKRVSWPWTINVNGRGYVYETKQQAMDAVRKFQKQGESSIDVGCMQVNLKHHPKAFRHLEDAFDPQLNVAYAAQFLNNLKRQLGSWRTAVAHYHSATPQFHQPYREKIQKQWATLRKSAGNMTPISHDVNYLAHSNSTTPLPHSLVKQTNLQQTKARQGRSAPQVIDPSRASPPGQFYPINGTARNVAEPYARLTYRKFYHVLPQNQAAFVPIR